MTYVVAARWVAREGDEERVLAALGALAPASRQEPGCRLYLANRSVDDPRVILLYEQYHDAAAFQAHRDSAHFQKHAVDTAIPLLESREVTVYELLDV